MAFDGNNFQTLTFDVNRNFVFLSTVVFQTARSVTFCDKRQKSTFRVTFDTFDVNQQPHPTALLHALVSIVYLAYCV